MDGARRVVYQDLFLGEYSFQVKAIDRDLNYSEPATVRVTVLPDPRIAALNEALSSTGTASEFVGNSSALVRVQGQMAEVASTGVTIFILGETGTGKGLAARTLHGLSNRKSGPFIHINCGAIPDSLVESELFGHEKGTFTGAISRKLGKVELAVEGTLFLDEIGDLPLAAQVELLRLLDEHAFERLGGTETINPDVRIVVATNRDLQEMVEAGQFREDLYFRLQVFPLRLPPLRERREDIPLLALYFMERMAVHLHKEVTRITPEVQGALQAYDWPGNVRELEHAIQRAVIVCREATVQVGDISLGQTNAKGDSVEGFVTLDAFERRYICRVLEQADWVIGGSRGAATVLGLKDSTLRGRMRKLGIERPSRGI
jgi:transcriptional regulator with GAF, ATPase, and Fis domain